LIFSTHEAAGGNVAPSSAFEAADIRIYRGADGAAISATQRSSSNGITMTSPFDSLTGVHEVDIDLTDNTDAGFYASGYQYTIVLAPDETVDSATLTGVVLGYFEVGTQPVNVTHAAGTAWASGAITAASIATGAVDRDALAADTGLQPIRANTAQAGGASTITLDASASAVDDFYNGTQILLTGGTGAGQARIATDYVGATKVLTVNAAWATNPDNTTTWVIFPAASTEDDIAAAVWNSLQASYTDPGTFGLYLDAAVSGVSTGGVSVGDIADAVWDEARAGHVTAGTFGAGVKTESLNTQAKADVNAEVVDAINVDVLADSVPTDGTRPTLAQAAYVIHQFLTEASVSGTTLTVRKVDGSTALMTFTLNSSSAPTSITRTT
jgi:hypothetical protein